MSKKQMMTLRSILDLSLTDTLAFRAMVENMSEATRAEHLIKLIALRLININLIDHSILGEYT